MSRVDWTDLELALHNRERFYLATLRNGPQCPIRRLTTPSLARSSLWSARNATMQNVFESMIRQGYKSIFDMLVSPGELVVC
jgi:hypothetical protein